MRWQIGDDRQDAGTHRIVSCRWGGLYGYAVCSPSQSTLRWKRLFGGRAREATRAGQ